MFCVPVPNQVISSMRVHIVSTLSNAFPMHARLDELSGCTLSAHQYAKVRWMFQRLKEMFPTLLFECEYQNNVV